MTPTDDLIEQLIQDCRLLGNALNADGQSSRAGHVLNAMADLIRARDPDIAQTMDEERIERARA